MSKVLELICKLIKMLLKKLEKKIKHNWIYYINKQIKQFNQILSTKKFIKIKKCL